MTESSWHALLAPQSPRWRDGDLLDFGDAEAERQAAGGGSVICPLQDLAVLRAQGPDAEAFLQGQLSNDVRALRPRAAQLAAYCTPRGRMLALFRVVRQGDGFLLLLPRQLAPAMLRRLKMFVLRARVSLEDVGECVLALGVGGEAAQDALSGLLGELPAEADTGLEHEGTLVVRLPTSTPRYLVLAGPEAMAALWAALARAARPAGPEAWRLLDVRDALPQVWPGTQESFVPQMANLDRVNGLSFNKGCYPGQEIVARMHFLGTLKRRMYGFTAAGETAPEPGAAVRDGEGALVGEVVSAVPGPGGRVEGLAVLQIERALEPGLRAGDVAIEVRRPPYSLEGK